MAKIQRFEELESWQTARAVVQLVYKASSNGDFSRDFALRDQIRRAAVSIMANIAEGISRRSNREFVQFLFMAKASASEAQSHMYVALDQGYLNQEEFRLVYAETDRCARQISALITYLLGRQQSETQLTRKTRQTR
ncbi:MAG: four helix bundle protein [Candidatus Methylomirabilales bacterium]